MHGETMKFKRNVDLRTITEMNFALTSNKKHHEQLYYGIYIKETKVILPYIC